MCLCVCVHVRNFFFHVGCWMSGGEEKIPGDKETKAIRVCPPSLLLFRFSFFLLTHKTFRILFLSHLFPVRCRSCCRPLLIQEYLEEEEKYMFKFPRIAISFREDSN